MHNYRGGSLTMKTMTEIKPAIARSISHNEIVLLTVADPKAALDQIDNDENVTELDWTDSEIGLGKIIDVWGKRLGGEFRLNIIAEAR
jgi:hypothetical protein